MSISMDEGNITYQLSDDLQKWLMAEGSISMDGSWLNGNISLGTGKVGTKTLLQENGLVARICKETKGQNERKRWVMAVFIEKPRGFW